MKKKILGIVILLLLGLSLSPAVALANGDVLLSSATYVWTDPASGGVVEITENVYDTSDNLMKWEYVVENIDYDPEPGITNGFSGFQIVFPQQVAEVANQTSPAVGGPWVQNAYSGTAPPWGVEWDAPHPGTGIMPGQTGIFSYTTEERERVVLDPNPGWAHSWGEGEPIIDLDGTATPGPGILADQQVSPGDPLIAWADAPTGGLEGIDWFDNDWDGASPRTWSALDDLHVEDPTFHPTAFRDGFHDNNASYVDPMVLDQGAPLPDGTPVSVDLEANLDFFGGSGVDPAMAFFDNGDGSWNDGEDIVLDVNGDRIFGFNIQTDTFTDAISVPGERYLDITKELVAASEMDGDGDGIIDLGEDWSFTLLITVTNTGSSTVSDVMVKDNLGGDLELLDWIASTGTFTSWTTGKTAKVHMTWEIGDMAAGQTEQLTLLVSTDMNTGNGNGKNQKFPNGHQEYTSEGEHCLNSGATVKGIAMLGGIEFEVDYTTDPICVEVGEMPPVVIDGN